MSNTQSKKFKKWILFTKIQIMDVKTKTKIEIATINAFMTSVSEIDRNFGKFSYPRQ